MLASVYYRSPKDERQSIRRTASSSRPHRRRHVDERRTAICATCEFRIADGCALVVAWTERRRTILAGCCGCSHGANDPTRYHEAILRGLPVPYEMRDQCGLTAIEARR